MNICTWSMLYLGKTPEEAFKPFKCTYPPFPFFHDASPCVCTYNLSILDCLRGTYRAHSLGFFNFDKFDVEEYEKYEKVEYGDLNWLREGKVTFTHTHTGPDLTLFPRPSQWLAFAAPCDKRTTHHEMYVTLTPEDYVGYFKKRYVGLIVRLNKAYYDKTRFTKRGFRHRGAKTSPSRARVESHFISLSLSLLVQICTTSTAASPAKRSFSNF